MIEKQCRTCCDVPPCWFENCAFHIIVSLLFSSFYFFSKVRRKRIRKEEGWAGILDFLSEICSLTNVIHYFDFDWDFGFLVQ